MFDDRIERLPRILGQTRREMRVLEQIDRRFNRSDQIEINLLESLGEPNLPSFLEPVHHELR